MSRENPTPQERYAKKNRRDFRVPCFESTESDIIKKLESVPNISGYIKKLIRADIKRFQK